MVASDHGFSRECTALSMGLVDKYLQTKSKVDKSELQTLGFVAVGLAGKIEDNKQISMIEKIFGKIDIISFELEIMKTLGFNLKLDTYIFWAKSLMGAWDNFKTESEERQSVRFLDRSFNSYARAI